MNYSIHVPSIRTSSKVYVNGRLLAQSGRVGESEKVSIANNLPYSATFTADKDGVIELMVQASNYVDSRSGGIVRSIKFGSEQAIIQEMKISVSMQVLTTVIFLIHSAYALILFILGNKEKKLLYFSLLTFCFTLSSGLSNDEKLLHQIFTSAMLGIFGYPMQFFCLEPMPFWNVLIIVNSLCGTGSILYSGLSFWGAQELHCS